jgi:hypothetical protein
MIDLVAGFYGRFELVGDFDAADCDDASLHADFVGGQRQAGINGD